MASWHTGGSGTRPPDKKFIYKKFICKKFIYKKFIYKKFMVKQGLEHRSSKSHAGAAGGMGTRRWESGERTVRSRWVSSNDSRRHSKASNLERETQTKAILYLIISDALFTVSQHQGMWDLDVYMSHIIYLVLMYAPTLQPPGHF